MDYTGSGIDPSLYTPDKINLYTFPVQFCFMKKFLLSVTALFFATIASSQQKPAYVLYDSKGNKVSYKKMIRQLAKKEIVLFGEFHNNPISHWLELSVAKDLKEKKRTGLRGRNV